MTTNSGMIKKIYDQTARSITTLHFKGRLSEIEMVFLLNLLENIIFSKSKGILMDTLDKWQKEPLDEEIDAIVRATILGIDFLDADSITKGIETVNDLLLYSQS